MQPVLILAYYYPPCPLTASARPASWAAYLAEFGYYPTVISRSWEHPIASAADTSHPSGTEPVERRDARGRTIWMPYRGNLRDRIHARYGERRLRLARRALSFAELVGQNFTLDAVPFRNIYLRAVELLEADAALRKVIITANPFVAFQIGYALKRRFPRISWIADYRDDWSTSELGGPGGALHDVVRRLEARSERRWVGTAAALTTVSGHYRDKLSAFVGRPGHVLLNGFSEEIAARAAAPQRRADEFVITYSGTLYPTQPVEIFLAGYRALVERYGQRLKFRIHFPGVAFRPEQGERVRRALAGSAAEVSISERVPQEAALALQAESHALLMMGHSGLRGIPSSKLYEYLCFRCPIVLCPDDHDVIHETLADTGLGVFCDTADEVVARLAPIVEAQIAHGLAPPAGDATRIARYSRREQVRGLAALLDTL